MPVTWALLWLSSSSGPSSSIVCSYVRRFALCVSLRSSVEFRSESNVDPTTSPSANTTELRPSCISIRSPTFKHYYICRSMANPKSSNASTNLYRQVEYFDLHKASWLSGLTILPCRTGIWGILLSAHTSLLDTRRIAHIYFEKRRKCSS